MRLVVKLGGSVARSHRLRDWLAALAHAAAPLAIVPGGGPFADAVRQAQAATGFSDAAAHRMAILAMEQTGHALLDLAPDLMPAQGVPDFAEAERLGRSAVWLPFAMALQAPDIPANWDMTSDALSAWLAGRLGARSLLLVKETDAARTDHTPELLARIGIVDPLMPRFLPPDVALFVCGPAGLPAAGALLAEGGVPGVAIARACETA